MRLSTGMIYDQQIQGIQSANSSWLKAGNELATGNRVNKPSDDPVAAAQAVVLSQAQSETSQYETARVFATQNQSTEETTLKQVADVVISAQTTVVAASTGTLSGEDRASYATQLEGIRGQLLNLANSTDGNGRYMFAGYQSDKAPFTSDAGGKVTYIGGNVPIAQKVDASRTLVTNHTGKQVFDSLTSDAVKEPDGAASESNIFTILDTAIKSLKVSLTGADKATVDADGEVMAKVNRGLRNVLNNVSSVRSEIGTNLQELSNLDSKGDDTALSLKTQMSSLVGADTTEAISEYTLQQAALKASYTVFQQMSKLSLFSLNA
ncbi:MULTISPECIES: flagellar hook-associated protein FlgL [Erwinia]|uniref:Flagellar hook-associated protein FlgL n=1 Tax=Erwinia pyrifoliae TaxID=79967 RepID=A0ABY5X4P7_ERWPY|nr:MULTISPECIES: flagellar hook-associated protein FlgL [Erwinia]ADP12247.1 Flagellar hook-associated protein 3 [Erwinia sp. Ejp617]AUX72381.1 flagellar hook-filament junction protein FlgL [Erwinia pyrifoliae]MCA8877374.1 flagellar hook-filament junction protein FlgL [Erwinia pyrifoliae]MCT2388683.1 flagellar hook-associated protein FlgL [Erwinia pyrifoliae]MCU8586852.1 flagellar hook-associated protein FlgL [Erwinia pyrifoliae]